MKRNIHPASGLRAATALHIGTRCVAIAYDPASARENEVTDVTKANARIISGAPNLLTALEELIPLVAETFPKQQHVWLEAARAAIAKAKGIA